MTISGVIKPRSGFTYSTADGDVHYEVVIEKPIEELQAPYKRWNEPHEGYWTADRKKLCEALLAGKEVDGVRLVKVEA